MKLLWISLIVCGSIKSSEFDQQSFKKRKIEAVQKNGKHQRNEKFYELASKKLDQSDKPNQLRSACFAYQKQSITEVFKLLAHTQQQITKKLFNHQCAPEERNLLTARQNLINSLLISYEKALNQP